MASLGGALKLGKDPAETTRGAPMLGLKPYTATRGNPHDQWEVGCRRVEPDRGIARVPIRRRDLDEIPQRAAELERASMIPTVEPDACPDEAVAPHPCLERFYGCKLIMRRADYAALNETAQIQRVREIVEQRELRRRERQFSSGSHATPIWGFCWSTQPDTIKDVIKVSIPLRHQ